MRSTPVRMISGTLATAAMVVAAGAFLPRGSQPAAEPATVARAAAVMDTAVFAGGCFWSMEKAFEHQPGVVSATSGYSGGTVPNPSYEDVGSGRTGHAESVQVVFDPSKTTYERLLDVYWHNIDPISTNGQICDHGSEYRSIVFYRGAGQRRAAEASKAQVQRHFTRPVTTQLVAAMPFYAAEEYHQNFAERNPVHYNAYRVGCGRDARLHELWGDAAGGPH
ncbi:MAG TPA: peptide-methionine (S)-S-oxide reductase MsrA [Longimicrobiaceae bacterium]|nr:peptide-methionine (S)-S-oxide reductase MsrA [Longimicrobiaceae bacterium]